MSSLLTNLLNRDKRIKGRQELDTLAISTDGQVQLLKMPIVRQFLADHHEGSTPLSWAITTLLKPIKGITGVHLVQLISENSCVPQLTTYEKPYTNDSMKSVMHESYQRAKFDVDESNKKNITYEMIKLGIYGAALLFLATMIFSKL